MEIVTASLGCCASNYVILALVIVIFLYWYGTKTRRMIEATFPGIPGPRPWPFLGNMPGFIRDKGQLHVFLDRNYKKYGSLFSMSFFDGPALAVSDPKIIKEILVKHFDSFHNRPSVSLVVFVNFLVSLVVFVGSCLMSRNIP